MKKFASLLLIFSLLFSCTVFAQEPQVGSSTLTYTVDDKFWVYIPETIPVGETSQVQASEVNIDPSKRLYVRIMNMEESGGVSISNVNNPNSTLLVYFRDNNGDILYSGNNTIGSLTSSGESLYFTPYIESEGTADAGDYTGIIYFDISCE